MENRSRHYGDVAKWIETVIDSCVNKEQTVTVSKLVKNFDTQIKNKHIDMYWHTYYYEIIRPLENLIMDKEDKLSNQNFK